MPASVWLPADGGIRRGQCPGTAVAGDAAGANRPAIAHAWQRMRADVIGIPAGHHAPAGRHNRGSPRTARRQIGAVRRCVVPACGRRSANACADPRYRQHAGDPSARQPRRQSQRPAEITAFCSDFQRKRPAAPRPPKRPGLLDMPQTGFLYAARSRLRDNEAATVNCGGVAQLVRARES